MKKSTSTIERMKKVDIVVFFCCCCLGRMSFSYCFPCKGTKPWKCRMTSGNGLCMRTKKLAKISRIQRAIEDDGEKHRSMRRHRLVVVSGRWSVNVKDIYTCAIGETLRTNRTGYWKGIRKESIRYAFLETQPDCIRAKSSI